MPYTEILSLNAGTGTAPSGLFDGDAIKRAFTPPLVATTYEASTLDGEDLVYRFERAVTVTTSASALTFNVNDPIVIHGFSVDNTPRSAFIKLSQTGGNETKESAIGFYRITRVVVPAQLLAAGTMSVGVGAVILTNPATAIESGVAGVVKLGTKYGDHDVSMPANLVRELTVYKIRRDNATFPVLLYR